MLKNLIEMFAKYKTGFDINYLNELINCCTALSNSMLFKEWYEDIKKTEVGKEFSKVFDNYWARTNTTKQS